MFLDAADEDIAEIGVAQHLRAFENGQSDRHACGGKRCMNSGISFELRSEPRAQIVLDRVDQSGQQGGGGEPLPLAQPGLVGEEQIGRGHSEALARGRQQEACRVVLFSPTVRSGVGHGFSLCHAGLRRR